MSEDVHKARIEKLRAMRLNNNGRGKDEMNAFIDNFERLSQKWGITLEDIEKATEADLKGRYHKKAQYSGKIDRKTGKYGWAWVDFFLWKAIARFCYVKVQTGIDADGDLEILFFGEDADVELAIWLRAHIRSAMAFHWEVYRDFCMAPNENISTAMYSFHHDMAAEIRERMDTWLSRRETASTGTALISTKNAVLDKMAADAGFVEERGSRGRQRAYDGSAGAVGRDAGKSVDLGRAVGGRATMITKQ